LSKAELTNRTKLSPRIVAAIDEGRLEQFPGGLYGRSFLRTYAEAVGIDAATIKAIVDAWPAMDVDLATVIDAREHRPALDDFQESIRRRAAAISTAI
jgi:hypothetical protein